LLIPTPELANLDCNRWFLTLFPGSETVPDIPFSVPWLLQHLPPAELKPPLKRMPMELLEIGLPQWKPNDATISESPTAADWRPRWPIQTQKNRRGISAVGSSICCAVSLSTTDEAQALKPVKRKLMEVFDSEDTRALPEASVDSIMILEEKMWSAWITDPLMALDDVLPRSPQYVRKIEKASKRSLQEIEGALSDIVARSEERISFPERFPPENGFILVDEDQSCYVLNSVISSIPSHQVLIIVASPLRAQTILQSRQGQPTVIFPAKPTGAAAASAPIIIEAARLPEFRPAEHGVQICLIIDSSCSNHDSVRSAGWTKEEIQSKNFFQRCGRNVSKVFLLCSQPVTAPETLQSILEIFRLDHASVFENSNNGLLESPAVFISYDTTEPVRKALRELLSLSHRNTSISEESLIDFVIQEQVDAKEAMKESIQKSPDERSIASERWVVACVCKSLIVGGAQSAQSALETFKAKFKSLSNLFWDSAIQPLASIPEDHGAVDELLRALRICAEGYFCDFHSFDYTVVAESLTDRSCLTSSLAQHPNVAVVAPEAVSASETDADIIILFNPSGDILSKLLRAFSNVVVFEVVTQESTVRARDKLFRKLWVEKARYV
jgi:hypothetical protein